MKVVLFLGLFLALSSLCYADESTTESDQSQTMATESTLDGELNGETVEERPKSEVPTIQVLGVLYYHSENRIEIVDQNYTRYRLHFIKTGGNDTQVPQFVKSENKLNHSLVVYLSNIPLIKFFGDVDGGSYFILEKDARYSSDDPLVHFYQLNWKEKTMFDLLGTRMPDLLMTTHVIDLNGDIKHYHYYSRPVLFGLLGSQVFRSDPDGSLTYFGRWMDYSNGPLCRMPHFIIKIPASELGVVIYRNSFYSIEPIQSALDMEPPKSKKEQIDPLAAQK